MLHSTARPSKGVRQGGLSKRLTDKIRTTKKEFVYSHFFLYKLYYSSKESRGSARDFLLKQTLNIEVLQEN